MWLALARKHWPLMVGFLTALLIPILIHQWRVSLLAQGRSEAQAMCLAEQVKSATAFAIHASALQDSAESDARGNQLALTKHHDAIQTDLQARLRDSQLHAAVLDRELVRLHDAAAIGALPDDPPADPAQPGAAPAAASAPALTCANLLTTAADNYGRCAKNAEQLRGLQQWYDALRTGQVTRP